MDDIFGHGDFILVMGVVLGEGTAHVVEPNVIAAQLASLWVKAHVIAAQAATSVFKATQSEMLK